MKRIINQKTVAVIVLLTLAVVARLGCTADNPHQVLDPAKSESLDTEQLPELVQNQVAPNPYVTETPPANDAHLSQVDVQDKFKTVPEEESVKNTPYGKPQI